jgi:hypothetical protein
MVGNHFRRFDFRRYAKAELVGSAFVMRIFAVEADTSVDTQSGHSIIELVDTPADHVLGLLFVLYR